MSVPRCPAYAASPELALSLSIGTSDPGKPKSTNQPALATPVEDSLKEGAPDSGDEQTDVPEADNPNNLDFSQY
ncbi:hypothetical protein NDA13_006011 [Ustilago tritici]|nr:hypothetical protein NDA13_006011 [Ustilago tritici]